MQPRFLSAKGIARIAASFAILLSLALAPSLRPHGATAKESDLVGDFSLTIGRLEVPQDLANGTELIGRWRVTFSADGTYEAERLDVGTLVTGTYEVDGDTVTINDEGGLFSCTNAGFATGDENDIATATYTWSIDDDTLTLTPVNDGCALRRELLSIHALEPFVACLTVPTAGATPEASPVAQATPVAEEESTARPGKTPRAEPTSDNPLLKVLTPAASTKATETGADENAADAAIDDLLAQMSACWATGSPDLFLPLLTDSFRAQFISGTDQAKSDALQALTAAMATPIAWERAGDVELDGDTKASAVIRTTSGDQQEFVRYNFAFEDGAWLWDGSAG